MNTLRFWHIAYGILLMLIIADTLLTYSFLQYGGEEGNPLMAYLLDEYGFWALALSKAIGAIALPILLLLHERKNKESRWFTWPLPVLIVLLSTVVAWNVHYNIFFL